MRNVCNFKQILFKTRVSKKNLITERLSNLNSFLAKLDPALGAKLYFGFVSFAKHIDKASGGFMRFFNVNCTEAKLMCLSMIEPIIYDEDEEE